MAKRVVVFGATGHLGAYSAKYLVDCGYDVIAVGRREDDHGFWRSVGAQYIGGIMLESSEFLRELPSTGIDAVVHLAGAMPAHSGDRAMPYIRSIVEGMVNVCEWMREIGCRRIVFNTTPSDVSDHFPNGPVPEQATRSFPHNGGDHAIYAIAKNAAVDILSHYRVSAHILPCVFRHMTVYGWHPNQYYYRDGEKRVLPYRQIINDVVAGGPVEVWGDKDVKKELLYIKDFTVAIERAIASDVCGLFNLPGDRPYTTEEQIDGFITAFATKPIKKIYCPEKPSSPSNLLLLGGAKTYLGWYPRWSWTEACKDWAIEAIASPFRKLWQ